MFLLLIYSTRLVIFNNHCGGGRFAPQSIVSRKMLYFENMTYSFHSFGMFLTYWIVYLPHIQHFDSTRKNNLLNAYLLISENQITYCVFLPLLTASLKCYPHACFFPATVRMIYTNNENENLRHLLVKRGKTGRGRITPCGRITPLSDTYYIPVIRLTHNVLY